MQIDRDKMLAGLENEKRRHPEKADEIDAEVEKAKTLPHFERGAMGQPVQSRRDKVLAAYHEELKRARDDAHRAAILAEIERIENAKPNKVQRTVAKPQGRQTRAAK